MSNRMLKILVIVALILALFGFCAAINEDDDDDDYDSSRSVQWPVAQSG